MLSSSNTNSATSYGGPLYHEGSSGWSLRQTATTTRIPLSVQRQTFAPHSNSTPSSNSENSMKSPPWQPEDLRIVFGSTKIDYDLKKESYNIANHKYSLESAVDLLEHLILPINTRPHILRDASTTDERRHEHISADSDGDVVFFVTTMRPDETVRVISLRRAHPDERKIFASLTGYEERKSKKTP
jgi:uncharacterized DUF497 family protein